MEDITIQTKTRSKLGILVDLWLLMKPELTILSVFTSLASALLALESPQESQIFIFPILVMGTLFVGGGAGALNQYIEREFDALMKRTEKRPIPDLRLSPRESLLFGIAISIFGIMILSSINLLTGFLAAITLITYLFLYTPLKQISAISTIIGAIPGALPTLIGWASIRNSLSIEALTLFAILFYWQMPHFYSISWFYRHDYVKAGYRLLASLDPTGRKVARYVFLNQLILIPIGLSPVIVGLVSWEYIPISLASSIVFLFFGWRFRLSIETKSSGSIARKLFFASLFYLPIAFSSMILYKVSP